MGGSHMLIGHETNINILKELLAKRQGGISLLFWGPEQIGKKSVALSLAKGFLCEHANWGGCIESGAKQPCAACAKLETSGVSADFLFVDQKLRETIKGAEAMDIYDTKGARKLIAFLDTKPLVGTFRVLLVDDAHLLDREAQNTLLKTLEEPFDHAVVILVTHKPMALLDTVRSRLMQLSFGLVSEDGIRRFVASLPGEQKTKEKAMRYCFMRPGMAHDLLVHEKAIQTFESRIKAMLALEALRGTELGPRIAAVGAMREREISDPDAEFALWQAVVRDEILIDLGLSEYARILTKQHGSHSLRDRLFLVHLLVEAERWVDAGPSAFKSAFEYVAMKL